MTRPLATLALVVALFAGSGGALAQRYVAFGDSITRGFGDDTGRGGYPGRLDALLDAAGQTATVENKGKDGETTAEGLSRLSTLRGAADEILLIMEGTNDVALRVSNETIVANLNQMVRKGRQLGFGRIHLATVIPRGIGAQAGAEEATTLLAADIRQAAHALQILQPDPYQVFADAPNFRSDLISGDSVHPTSRGYDVLADHFADVILGRDQLAPVPSFVTPEDGAFGVAATALLEVVLFDSESGVDQTRATLTVNGVAVSTTVSGDPFRTVLRARPGNLAGRPLLGVDAFDLESPANRRLQALSQFTVKGTKFLKGDIDASGRVDGADLVELARAFGTSRGDPLFDADADLDGNDRVNGSDLAILAANFGLSSF